MLLILVIGGTVTFFSLARGQTENLDRIRRTEITMMQVKQAIIGWSASRTPTGSTPNARPGELPCPDIDNTGTDPGGCSAGAVGRVPWKTLGIPEPKDSDGETLWYAISGPFRYYHPTNNPAPIISDTLGNLTVYLGSSATTLTSNAVAVIFSPGEPIGAQSRGCTIGVNCNAERHCTTTPPSLTPLCNPTNYLESTGGGNNAQTGGPFVQAAKATGFNDRVLSVSNQDLMPLVEKRVAYELMSLLNQYRQAVGTYPWADVYDGDSNDGYNRPRFPCGNASPVAWGNPGPPMTPVLPNWLVNGCGDPVEGWTKVIFYSAAEDELSGSTSCSTCSEDYLDIISAGDAYLCTQGAAPFTCIPANIASGDAEAILITPGAWDGVAFREWTLVDPAVITGYFSDAENSDNNDDDFVMPAASYIPNRNRVFVMR
ncbi:MAG: hypothetical protein ACKVP2_14490 [Burkholderiales bacterium]